MGGYQQRYARGGYTRDSHRPCGLVRGISLTIIMLAALTAGICVSWLLSGCSMGTPPARDHPLIACRYDSLQRFNYALIIERVGGTTTWIKREVRSARPDLWDREERVDPDTRVRPGYCPDESAAIITGGDVWRQ